MSEEKIKFNCPNYMCDALLSRKPKFHTNDGMNCPHCGEGIVVRAMPHPITEGKIVVSVSLVE